MPRFGGEFSERGLPGGGFPKNESVSKKRNEPTGKGSEKSLATQKEIRELLVRADFDVNAIPFNEENTKEWTKKDFKAAINERNETAFRILTRAGIFENMGKKLKKDRLTNTDVPEKKWVVEKKAIIDKARMPLKKVLLEDIKAIDDEYLRKELMDRVFGLDAEQSREK